MREEELLEIKRDGIRGIIPGQATISTKSTESAGQWPLFALCSCSLRCGTFLRLHEAHVTPEDEEGHAVISLSSRGSVCRALELGVPVPLQRIHSGVTQAIVLPHACLVSQCLESRVLKKIRMTSPAELPTGCLNPLTRVHHWKEFRIHVITRSTLL
jgi:hypothetical protein